MTTAQDRRLRRGLARREPLLVLTVGLEPRALESIRRNCANRRWACDPVRSGREALGYLRMTSERLPAMIFCAEVLPDGSWRQLLDWTHCRLIVVSPSADGRLWAEALHVGVCDLLPDPFTEVDLNWTMESAQWAWRRERALAVPV